MYGRRREEKTKEPLLLQVMRGRIWRNTLGVLIHEVVVVCG
jgi:hypothetical protein